MNQEMGLLRLVNKDLRAENERLRAESTISDALLADAKAEIERLRAQKAGWEVGGFIDRLTKRDDTNSERLVLEAISHLRAFSRDCDALRDNNRELRAEIERLQSALKPFADLVEMIECATESEYTDTDEWEIAIGYLRAARKALEGK